MEAEQSSLRSASFDINTRAASTVTLQFFEKTKKNSDKLEKIHSISEGTYYIST